MIAHHLLRARAFWRSVLIVGVVTPLLYILALGVGLGTVVNRHGNPLGVPYLVFVAPAFLAAAAVQVAAGEATWPVMAGFKWMRTYHSMAASPLSPTQIADGVLGWIGLRLLANSLAYFAIMAGFGAVRRGTAVLAIPAAALAGLAFAAPVAALAATVGSESQAFNVLFRFVVTPMFLFSGTFYPISQLPGWGQWLARISPLWHGTELARAAAIGGQSWAGVLGHAAYLLALLAGGVLLSRWRFRVRIDDMTATPPRAAASGGLLRILPPGMYARRGHIVLERALRVYRRGWMVIFSGFFEPLFYLFALGTGLRSLVGTVTGPGGQPISYTAFIAPALLASSAMNGAIYDSTMNVFHKLKWGKIYESMLATSLGPLDVAVGEIGWALIRGGLYSAGFLAVMAVLGLTASWWAVLLLPAALLIAFGFAAVGMAVTSYLKSFQDLDLVQLAVLPMFLFSGTFYSLSVYPSWLRIVVECLPLQHGVALMRDLNAGVLGWGLLGHTAYFVAMAAAGVAVTARRLDRMLLR